MTATEKQEIVDEVLNALYNTSLDIEDLTEVDSAPDDAYVELSGGRRVRAGSFFGSVVTDVRDL